MLKLGFFPKNFGKLGPRTSVGRKLREPSNSDSPGNAILIIVQINVYSLRK